jgi:hypothetical protein
VFAVISPNAIETAMAGKSLGLLAACLSGVPPLSAYAYQRSVSLLLASRLNRLFQAISCDRAAAMPSARRPLNLPKQRHAAGTL